MKPRQLAIVAVSAALAVTACGSKSDSSAEKTSATAEKTSATAAEKTSATAADKTSATAADTMSATETATGTMSATSAATGDNVCPEHLTIRADWFPELEHGGTYQLIGVNGTASKDSLSYSGDVQPQYAVGGLKTLEIQVVRKDESNSSSLLNGTADMAYINLSDLIKDSAAVDMVAIAKTLEKDPQMIMWDPAQNDVKEPADIAKTGKPVLHFQGVAYIDYMIGKGYMTEAQSDPSYDGADFAFVGANGDFFQQGFATNEVYRYEHNIDWKDGKPAPVKYFTVGDLGFDNYPAAITMLRENADKMSECLKVLVPTMQQAWVDYYNDPQPILDKLIEINTTYDTFWKLNPEGNAAGMKVLQDGGFAANSPDGTYCSFDKDRIQGLYDILKPIYDKQGTEIAPSIDTLFTNEYCAGAPAR